MHTSVAKSDKLSVVISPPLLFNDRSTLSSRSKRGLGVVRVYVIARRELIVD